MTAEAMNLRGTVYMKLASALAKRATRESARALPWVQSLVRVSLHIAGFSSLTYGAFMWDKIAGFIVLGISCFVMSALTTSAIPESTDDRTPRRRM